MLDPGNRWQIMEAFGNAVDDLVRDLYSELRDGRSLVQEAEITSRLCQRLEDRLDNTQAGDYVFRVTAQSLPDRGPGSLEKITGADLMMSVSLDGQDGFDKSIFVQTKYDRNIDREDLVSACGRMEKKIGRQGGYVWIYRPDGVEVFSHNQINNMRGNTMDGLRGRSMTSWTGRILDCYAGSQKWGIPAGPDRRRMMQDHLVQLQVDNALDVVIKHSKDR